MRILFVWPSAEFSIWDVARGYRNALERQGTHEIRDYKLYARMKYHATAMGDVANDIARLARVSSENVVIEAMRHRADLVLIISGMALHPEALWFLKSIGMATRVLFTESPYNDPEQADFHAVYPEMRCFTNERVSAREKGWRYVRHAHDPLIHIPRTAEKIYDVLLIGTLWKERIQILNQVDWTGINLKLMGMWAAPPLPHEVSVGQFYEEGCIHNAEVPGYYAQAKICLNPHRAHPSAESLNPRTYELAACRAFQLTDNRAELADVFGKNGSTSVVSYDDSQDLEEKVRYWLGHEKERQELIEAAAVAVKPHTFDERVATLMEDL